MPGVDSAVFVNHLPIGGDIGRLPLSIEGRPAADLSQPPTAVVRTVTADYARAMGLALVRGRALDARDAAAGEPVVAVNEAFARSFFDGGDPTGARLKLGPPEAEGPWRRIVGVVSDARQASLVEPVRPEVLFPYEQDPVGWFAATTLVVRTGGDPGALAAPVLATLRAAAPELPVPRARAMSEVLAAAIARDRFNTLLLGALAAVALFLAGVGLYAVMAYAVGRRRHEIGVRMALGARSSAVVAMVLRDGLRLAAAGAAIGLALALALSRLLVSVLHEVSATDPAAFAGAAAVLVGVAVVACLVPARRAARVDPVATLRQT
ncbi:MAG: FtsX-like permease family protein [Vicinamibacteria bacterium]